MTTFLTIYLLIGAILSIIAWIGIIKDKDNYTRTFVKNIYESLINNRDIFKIIVLSLYMIITDLLSIVFWPIIFINWFVTR